MEFIKKYTKYITSGLVLLSILCLFLQFGAYVYEGSIQTWIDFEATGFNLIFGVKDDAGYVIYGFNIVGLIMLILLAISLIIPLIKFKDNFIPEVIESGLLIFATIIYFIFPKTIQFDRVGIAQYFRTEMFVYVGAVLALAALVLSVYSIIKTFKSEEEQPSKK